MRGRALIAAAVAAGLLTACGSGGGTGGTGGSPATTSKDGAVAAVFSNVAETPTLDPAVAYSSDGFEFVRNVYEGLLEYEPGTTKLRPLLATKWTTSPDGLTYTLTLREGVKFHDGAPFDAEAAKTGLERIKGVNQGPATLLTNVASITAPAPDTLVIKLKQRDVYFLGALPKLPLVSPKAIADHATAKDKWAEKWFATNAAGTGPYELDSWQRNSAIQLRKFDDYWRPFEPGTPTSVTLRVDPDVQTALQLLAQGKIDMMGAVGPDDSAAAKKMQGVKLVEQPSYQVQTVPLNVSKGPLKDPRVRQAIALAFDYGAMVDFYKGFTKPATGPLPADFTSGGKPMAQDLAKAKQLMAEAGHPNGGFTLTYLGLKGLAYEEFTGTLLEDSLKKLGIKVKQTLVPWPQMVEIQSKPSSSADMSFLNQSPLTDDPSYMLASAYASDSLASKGGYNWSYVNDPSLDKRIEALATITDESERDQAVAELNQQIVDQYLSVYVSEPTLAQPVRDAWDVKYDNLDYDYVVRFFYARKR